MGFFVSLANITNLKKFQLRSFFLPEGSIQPYHNRLHYLRLHKDLFPLGPIHLK